MQIPKKYANHLIDETSSYLLQHAHNPVDWYPSGEEAFERARAEDKPLLVSIGYSACHWCHVMEHESFEDEAVAAIMNEHFITIKVDMEERPDVDQIYMNFVQLTTGRKPVRDRLGEGIRKKNYLAAKEWWGMRPENRYSI